MEWILTWFPNSRNVTPWGRGRLLTLYGSGYWASPTVEIRIFRGSRGCLLAVRRS